MLPTDVIFDRDLWFIKDNYMQIVRANENYDNEIRTWNYYMMDGFDIIILARFDTDAKCADLLSKIPHSDRMTQYNIYDKIKSKIPQMVRGKMDYINFMMDKYVPP